MLAQQTYHRFEEALHTIKIFKRTAPTRVLSMLQARSARPLNVPVGR